MSDAFISLDRQWICTRVNLRAGEMLAKDLLGKNLWNEFPGAAKSEIWEKLHRVMEERTTLSYESHYPPLQKWFEVDCFPTEEGVSLFFRDITSRKQSEESLKSSEGRYRFLAESMSQYVWTSDLGCRLGCPIQPSFGSGGRATSYPKTTSFQCVQIPIRASHVHHSIHHHG